MSEQRIHPRVDVNLEVQYQPVPEFLTASSMNISIGGVYICTPQPQPRDREILLRFTLPGVAHPLQISGIVVWSNQGTSRSPFPPGMGIKFLNVTDTDATLLADFVAKAQGQGSPAASVQEPAPPAPVSVGADDLGIVVLTAPAEPAQAASPPPAAKPPVPSPPAAPPQEPPLRSTAPPASAPDPEIPEHIRRQIEHMLSLQAPPSAPEPVRPAPPASGPVSPSAPAEKPVAPSPSGQPPRTTQPGQPGQSSQKTRPPQKPREKKKT
jgi:uncharacterized protein (TIGR02266 family)